MSSHELAEPVLGTLVGVLISPKKSGCDYHTTTLLRNQRCPGRNHLPTAPHLVNEQARHYTVFLTKRQYVSTVVSDFPMGLLITAKTRVEQVTGSQ